MTVSEAQKKSAAQWNKKNMPTITARVRTEKIEAFKKWCKVHNKTVSGAIAEFIDQCINDGSI